MTRHRRMIRTAAVVTLLLLGIAAYALFNPAFAATCKAVFRTSVTWVGQRAEAIGKALAQPASYTPSKPAPKAFYDGDDEAKPEATKEISFSSAANRWKKHAPAPESDEGEEAEAGQIAR